MGRWKLQRLRRTIMSKTHEAIVKIIAYREQAIGKSLDEVVDIILEKAPFTPDETIIAVLEEVFACRS